MAGEEPLDLGPAPGDPDLSQSLLLRRVGVWLALAIGRMLLGDSGYEPLSLARLACDIGDDAYREIDVLPEHRRDPRPPGALRTGEPDRRPSSLPGHSLDHAGGGASP